MQKNLLCLGAVILALCFVSYGGSPLNAETNHTMKFNQTVTEDGLVVPDEFKAFYTQQLLRSAGRGQVIDFPFSDVHSVQFSPRDDNLAIVRATEREYPMGISVLLWNTTEASIRVVAQNHAKNEAKLRGSPDWSLSGDMIAWCEYTPLDPSYLSPSSSRVEPATSSVLYIYDVQLDTVVNEVELPFIGLDCVWPLDTAIYILENVWFAPDGTPYGRMRRVYLENGRIEISYAARGVLIQYLASAGGQLLLVEYMPPRAALSGTPPTSRHGAVKVLSLQEDSPKARVVFEWSGYSLSDFCLSRDGTMLACSVANVNVGGMSVLGLIDIHNGKLHRSVYDSETKPLCWLPSSQGILCKKRLPKAGEVSDSTVESRIYLLSLDMILGNDG